MNNKKKEMEILWNATDFLLRFGGDSKEVKVSIFREGFKAFVEEWDNIESKEDKKLLFDYFEKLVLKLI